MLERFIMNVIRDGIGNISIFEIILFVMITYFIFHLKKQQIILENRISKLNNVIKNLRRKQNE